MVYVASGLDAAVAESGVYVRNSHGAPIAEHFSEVKGPGGRWMPKQNVNRAMRRLTIQGTPALVVIESQVSPLVTVHVSDHGKAGSKNITWSERIGNPK